MTAITEAKTPSQNRLEGFALTALFQGLPTYATALLAIKIMGAREIVGSPEGPVIFVVLASLLHGILVPWLAPKFPKTFRARPRAAVLRLHPVVLRKDRAMARPAGSLAAARDDGDHDVGAGGRRGEHSLKFPSQSSAARAAILIGG